MIQIIIRVVSSLNLIEHILSPISEMLKTKRMCTQLERVLPHRESHVRV